MFLLADAASSVHPIKFPLLFSWIVFLAFLMLGYIVRYFHAHGRMYNWALFFVALSMGSSPILVLVTNFNTVNRWLLLIIVPFIVAGFVAGLMISPYEGPSALESKAKMLDPGKPMSVIRMRYSSDFFIDIILFVAIVWVGWIPLIWLWLRRYSDDRAAVIATIVCGLLSGICWLIYWLLGREAAAFILDKEKGEIRYRKKKKQLRTVPFNEVKQVTLDRYENKKGKLMIRIAFSLRDGESWLIDESGQGPYLRGIGKATAKAVGVPYVDLQSLESEPVKN